MKWKNEIISYKPDCEQEIRDKETFLYCMNHFDDILSRSNSVVHITSSAFIINNDCTRTLMVYHNIYNSWSWTGGHVDGEQNFLYVAQKEAKEETGIIGMEFISPEILSLDVLNVFAHIKNGSYVSPHLHLSVSYGAVGNEEDVLINKDDENSDVSWIPIDKINKYSTEEHMKGLYNKLVRKINKIVR